MTAATAEDRDRVGPYRVIKAIGAGGSARIDLARIDRAYGFQRHVVLKRPLEHLRGDAQVAASLRREARIGGQLRHPNLVAILDAGTHDGYDYLVLEYVHGAALRGVMQGDAPGQVRALPLGVALAIVGDAARGMHEAHELTDEQGSPLGLVHRDVSPGNILLGLDGTVKLADFGIAKETRVSTLSGSMHGTVTYMAPEQCQGHAFDRRADIFSLGVILYELVTGTRLFWADNDVASLHRVLSGAVPRPRQIKPEIPQPLEDILMTAVAHAPEQRFATALDLAAAVEQYAVRAGEMLGARWIARTVEAVVGNRPPPWIAAETAASPASPEEAPAANESLVALIAAAGGDEDAVEPSFGEIGDVDGGGDGDGGGETGGDVDAAATAAMPSAPSEAREAPRVPEPAVMRPLTATDDAPPIRPRGRAMTAALVAIGVLAVGVVVAAIAIFATRSSKDAAAVAAPAALRAAPVAPTVNAAAAAAAPAAAAPATATTPAAAPAAATAPAAAGPAATAPAAGAGPAADEAAPAAASPPDHTPAVVDHPAAPTRRHRPPSKPPREPASTAATDAPPRRDAAPPTAGAAAAPTTIPQQPPATPPAKVEWKPTLLLPTDGSGGSAHP